MKKILFLLIILCSFTYSDVTNKDISIVTDAVNQAIKTQIVYETKEDMRIEQIKDLKSEITELKIENTIKDVLMVILAIARLSL